VHTLAVTVTSADGRTASDVLAVIPGRRLAVRDAVRVLSLQVAIDDGDIGVGVLTDRCDRRAAMRVRCRFLLYDGESGAPPRRSVLGRTTAELFTDAAGRPHVRGTSASRQRPVVVVYR
jgi:hypothetical protein